MEDIRQQFQTSSIEFLRNMSAELKSSDSVSKELVQTLFRRLHTIKGSAQTFGLINTANLAHDVESLLELFRQNSESDSNHKSLLADGLNFLVLTLEYPDFVVPDSFIEKITKTVPQTKTGSAVYLTLIPPQIFDQLTEFEKDKLNSMSGTQISLFCVDAAFDLDNFTDELQTLQNTLNQIGEIIFTLPGEKELKDNEIGFQIFLSCDKKIEDVESLTKDFEVEVKLLTAPADFSNDLGGILSKIVSQGKIWANSLGKEAEFKVLSDEPQLDASNLNLIFEILIQLVKNAVDHSIEQSGHVEIRLKESENGINIILSDDGKGIDPFLVRAKAIEQRLILSDTNLSEQETLDLIFLPGFSTAEKVTEISGRGVGLDSVQNLVVNANGTISVESQEGKGTVFEIFLPLDS